jgi:hypothetical protein
LVGLAVVLALVVVVGGILEVGRGSAGYRRDVNRSYADAGSVLVDQSNEVGAQLSALMGDMPAAGRTSLTAQLDSLASASARLAASAAALSPPDPTVSGLATALFERAAALARLRSAVGGLLGLGRTPSVGSAAAAAEIVSVGTLLTRADRDYAAVRRRMRAAPGSATLPRSAWVGDAQLWAPGPVESLVAQLAASPSLAPRPEVVLVPSTVRLEPAAVPRVTPGGPSVVPPTRVLTVSVVVADRGNVAVGGLTVSARTTPQGPGRAASASTRVSLDPSSTVSVDLSGLGVQPGDTYTLTVSVVPPPGQSDLSTTSLAYAVRVAPPTPPTTTTTAPATTTTTRAATTTTAPATTTTTRAATATTRARG